MINLIKSQPLNTHVLIFCVMQRGSAQKALLLPGKAQRRPPGKALE